MSGSRLAVLLAAAAVAGAWLPGWAPGLGPAAGLVAAAAVIAACSPWRGVAALLAMVAVGLVASLLAGRSFDALREPVPEQVRGVATLVTDPEWVGGALRADLALDGRRYEAWFRGAAAGSASVRLAGERLALGGTTRPIAADRRGFADVRHVAASLSVADASPRPGGPPLHRVANRLRRAYSRGAATLDDDAHSLFTGFVYGDDRGQPPGIRHDFRVAGLTHLLAVSGQNVAFVLALFGPLLRRLGLRGRLALSLAVMAQFAVLTRAEPSVLRATAMTGLATGASTIGRPVAGVRLLASAVIVLVMVDPLLARSVGFGLSVLASGGILAWAERLHRALPGPRAVTEPLAVTIAAQAAVAPLLVAVFGAVPLVAIPANLLVAPVAGPIMVWGLTAGLVAGVAPGLADLVHVPTAALIGYVQAVARGCASLPVGDLGGRSLAAAAGLAAISAGLRRVGADWRRPAALGALLIVAAALAPARPGPPGAEIADGARLYARGGSSVLVLDDPWVPDLLAALRRHGVGDIDLVVVATTLDRDGLAALHARHRLGAVARASDLRGVLEGGDLQIDVAPFEVVLRARGSGLEALVAEAGPSRPGR